MVRIRIDDLPISEQLTPEEEEQILGAGRRSFRPMLEQLEGRELYSANVTASLTAGVLNVRGQHVQGTPNNDAVAIRRVDNQIQVMSGPKNETMVGKFDAAQVRTIDLLMEGGGDAVLDLTGLGRLGGDARFNTKGDGGTADVRYVNQAGSQVREWEAAGRHNKETILANGDKVLEQSWQDGQLTRRFVTVTDTRGRQLVTAEDNGNGFVVTRTHPGVSQTKFKFDRYGGMWDGKDWAPEQGQKLVERDGKAVNGEMKMIDNKLRFVLTTGSQSDRHVETYEAFGNGSGEKKLSVEDYKDNKLSRRETFNADGSRTVEDFKDNNLVRRETFKADGSRTVEDYKNGVLSRRETTSDKGEVRSRIEVYNDAGQLQTVDTIDKNGTKSHGEWKGDKWVVTTPGSGNVLTRT